MKKILIIVWFVIVWLFGFESRVEAQNCASYDTCVDWCVWVNNQTCMTSCWNQYPWCAGQAWVPTLTEDSPLSCQENCNKNYAEWSARTVCNCRCNWNIVLNTEMPFIWRCLEKDSNGRVVGEVSQAITKILMSLILVRWFGNLIFAWVQFASNNPTWGKKRVINTIVAFAVLGSVWLILRLINPNIFK